jgi:hypothetical protein
MKHIKGGQVSPTGIPYLEFILIFRKTNKDPNKGKFQIVDINGDTHATALSAYLVVFDDLLYPRDLRTQRTTWTP